MKRLWLALSLVTLLSACVQAGVAPNERPCANGQYWSTSSQACQESPKAMDRNRGYGALKMANE